MKRREFLQLAFLASATQWTDVSGDEVFGGPRLNSVRVRVKPFPWEEATIAEVQAQAGAGTVSSVSLTRAFLRRIDRLNRRGPALNAVIEINPDATAIARELDRERRRRGPRGSLHGIPILIKDNLDTHDRMMTTAGSLALLGSIPSEDSFVVRKLRGAGAVLLGKTNLSEWANFRSSRSTSGWSGRGGQTKNPYVLDRNPSGSSSGSAVAVAANLCMAAIGTETDGSIISPSSLCGIVGIKPTVGLVSRAGIIPISQSQDTAGPMARTVTDAAILLGAIVGVDSDDPATEASAGKAHGDYTQFLDGDGLRGARIGVARRFFRPGTPSELVLENAIEAIKNAGATVVDPADLPTHGKFGDSEYKVFLYEFKAGLNAYLARLSPEVAVHSLEELIEFNKRNANQEMPYFGQETFVSAQSKGPLTEREYLDALTECRRLSREEGIDAVMNEHKLDAIVAPSGGPADRVDLLYGSRGVGGSSSPAAVAGYPNISVPAGHVFGLPVGISFFGRAWSEPVLLKIAFAFEQVTRARRAPEFFESVP